MHDGILLFESWCVLNESIKNAKDYMHKFFAQKKNKKTSDLSPEELKTSLEHKSFQNIIKLTTNNPGYSVPFLKFHFEQGVPISSPQETEEIRDLTKLLDWLIKNTNSIRELPKPVEVYASSKPIGGIKGFEQLTDAIRTIERRSGAKWLFDRLPKNLKDNFRKLPQEGKDSFFNIAYSLDELDEGDPKKPITTRLLVKIKAMANWGIEELIEYCSNYVKSYKNLEVKKKIEEVARISPEAGILYFDDPYLAISIRTEEAQKQLCKIANWCLNRGSWSTYVNDHTIQVNIFDYSLIPADNMFLIGITIQEDGTVVTSHDINDKILVASTGNRNRVGKFLTSLGYSEELAAAVEGSVDREINVKKTLNLLYREKKGGNAASGIDRLLSSLFGMAALDLRGELGEELWNNVVEIVVEILENDDTITEKNILDFFIEYGIIKPEGLHIYETFLKSRINPDERKKVYDSSLSTFLELERYLAGGFSNSKVEKIKSILNSKGEILSALL